MIAMDNFRAFTASELAKSKTVVVEFVHTKSKRS